MARRSIHGDVGDDVAPPDIRRELPLGSEDNLRLASATGQTGAMRFVG